MEDGDKKDAGPRAGAQPPARLAGTLPMLLLRAREALLERARPILRRYAITEAQWRVLRTLDVDGEMETTQLARVVYLRAPSLTRIARDLAAKGYLARRTAAGDGRVVIVSLLPAGHALVQEVLPLIREIAAKNRAAFGNEAQAELEQRLVRLIAIATGGED